jgi:hypothetical protein
MLTSLPNALVGTGVLLIGVVGRQIAENVCIVLIWLVVR